MIRRILLVLPLSAALMVSTNLLAQNYDDRHHVYDKKHNDYHDFNAHEDHAYHMYWQQHHHDYVDWARVSERQRQDYWNWRHNHSDAVLNVNIH